MSELGVLEPQDLSGYSRGAIVTQYYHCPLCSAGLSQELFCEELQIVGIGTVKVGYGHCDECGHIHQTRRPSAEVLKQYYERFSNYTMNFEVCEITKRLWNMSAGFTSIYEVGCGTGRHLAKFKERGQAVGGCDLSPAAVAAGKEHFGLDLDCGSEAECLPKQSDLDLIVYSGVLEHLPAPPKSLLRARTALADGGHVLVAVPCATATDKLPPGWLAFEHLHYYTPHTIRNLLAVTGFSLIESRINYKDFIYPVITCLAIKSKKHEPASEEYPGVSRQFLTEYLRRDEAFWAKAAKKINEAGDGELVIWGAGIHTSQLLDRIPGLTERVSYIIDSDKQKQQSTLGGIEIYSPETFFATWNAAGKYPRLLISSYANEWEIVKELAAYDFPESLQIRLYH